MLDAMVFFALAMLISSVVCSGVETWTISGSEPVATGGMDPGQVLEVFLGASLGAEVSLDLGVVVTMSSRAEVASCLEAELAALADGWDPGLFTPLNDAMLGVLSDSVGAGYGAVLSAYGMSDDDADPVLVLGEASCGSENRYSASCTVPGEEGCAHLVVLVLCPASLPELGHV